MAKKKVNLKVAKTLSADSLAKSAYGRRRELGVQLRKKLPKTVRELRHKGRNIRIVTTYDLRIDGRRVPGEVMVAHDGHVHYHGLPAYSFMSAVDLARQVIELFPQDYPPPGEKPRRAKRKKRHKSLARKRKGSRSKRSAAKKIVRKGSSGKQSKARRKSKKGGR